MADLEVQTPPESHLTPVLKVRFAADYIPYMPCCAASSLRSGMHNGGTALNRDKVSHFDESDYPVCLFGNSLEATETNFQWREMEHQSLDSVILRQVLKSKQPMDSHKPVASLTTPRSVGPLPVIHRHNHSITTLAWIKVLPLVVTRSQLPGSANFTTLSTECGWRGASVVTKDAAIMFSLGGPVS